MRPDSPDKGGQGSSGKTGGAGRQPGQPGQTGGGNRPQDWDDPMKNRDSTIDKDKPQKR
jgi:hypothetical protein